MSTDFELVIVSYHSRAQIEGLLANLPVDQPLVIVDNAGGADRLQDLVATRPRARYLDGGGNGFAKAANLGAVTSVHDVVVFGNPDSRPTPDHYARIVEAVAEDPTIASCAATMTSPDGQVELGTAGWEPSLRRAVVHALGLHKLWPTAGLFARPEPGSTISVDWTTGACMAVRRSTFLQLGGFDERYYVYNEDVAFGRVVRASGLRQVLRTDVLVPHAVGGSGAPSLEMTRLRGASMARYVSRHNPAAIALPIRLALAAGSVSRVAQRMAVRDPGRARDQLAYVAGVLSGRAFVGGRLVAGRELGGASPAGR